MVRTAVKKPALKTAVGMDNAMNQQAHVFVTQHFGEKNVRKRGAQMTAPATVNV